MIAGYMPTDWSDERLTVRLFDHETTGQPMQERVDHPQHYGGSGNPYEAIKVIEAWGLDFNLGNALKYLCRSQHEERTHEDRITDLCKASWYVDRAIERARPVHFQKHDPSESGDVTQGVATP